MCFTLVRQREPSVIIISVAVFPLDSFPGGGDAVMWWVFFFVSVLFFKFSDCLSLSCSPSLFPTAATAKEGRYESN